MPTLSTPPTPGGTPLPLESLASALADPLRWRILADLSRGEPRMVLEIARRFDRPPSTISKHMGVLRRAGIVVSGSGGLYRIADRFRGAPGQREIDLGVCLLRLGPVA